MLAEVLDAAGLSPRERHVILERLGIRTQKLDAVVFLTRLFQKNHRGASGPTLFLVKSCRHRWQPLSQPAAGTRQGP
jgi:hypothetical protein